MNAFRHVKEEKAFEFFLFQAVLLTCKKTKNLVFHPEVRGRCHKVAFVFVV